MPKGSASRRRKRAFERAQEGNLVNAALGKGSLAPRLVDAPKPEALDKLPKSLLKMMELQAAAEKERLRKQAAKERAAANASLQAAQQQPSAQGAATQATTQATGAAAPHGVAEQGQSGGARPQQQAPSIPTGGPALQKAPQRQQEHSQAQQQLQGTQDQVVHAQQQGQQPQPQGEGKQQQAATKQKQKNKHQQGQQQQQQGQSGQSGDVLQPGLLKVRQADGGERLYKTSQFEQISKKPLKERKKQYLKERKLKKKKGKGGASGAAAELVTPTELKLKAKQLEQAPKVGEVADAPLKVQLKRKHWAKSEQQAAAGGAQGGSTSNAAAAAGPLAGQSRLSRIFQQQMESAQARLQQGSTGRQVEEGPSRKKARGLSQGGAPAGKAGKGGVATPGAGQPKGLLAQAKAQAQEVARAQEKERLRLEAIQAYRQSKGRNSAHAGLASLAKLVQQGRGGASGAYTLA